MLFLKLRLLNPQFADLSKKKNDLVYTLSLTHLTLTLFDLTQQFHCLDLYEKNVVVQKLLKKKQTNWKKKPEETNQLWSIFPGAWHIYVCNGEFPNVFGRTAIARAQAQDPILLEGGPNEDNLRKVRVQGDWHPPFCVICRNLSFEYISVSWSRAVNNFNVFFFKIYLFLRSIHSTDSTSNQFLPFFFQDVRFIALV